MPELQGTVGELRFMVQVTHAATGQTEEVELVGFIDEDKLAALQAAGVLPAPETEKE